MASTFTTGSGLDASDSDRYRAELAAVLASDTLRRSPKLSRLLSYLCEKQLAGLAAEITEYSIAHEALGRGSKFDPQQDAVVRVDTHHLRKRLKEYYAGAGADHPIQIVIPTGQYAPRFVQREETPLAPEQTQPVLPESQPIAIKGTPGSWKWHAAALFVLVALGLATVQYRRIVSRRAGSQQASRTLALAQADLGEIRIAAGNGTDSYTDTAGRTWLPDRYFTGGAVFHRPPTQIQRTRDPELFQNGREGQFVYAIPLRPGLYELHLYFAETGVASDTLRSVNIAINGQSPAAFDIASDAAAVNTATVKIFRDISPAQDGLLHLVFQGPGPNFLNAIEILPGVKGKMLPIRITAGDAPFRDHLGQAWLPDQWFAGGRKSTRVVPIQGTSDAGLYQWERVGHFSYSIPVAEGGTYTVTLHFSETWFTSPNSIGGIGSRVFDVYCNGTTLLKGFDILKEAGAGNRAVARVFRHVSASPMGKIDLTFVPIVNYALVNALEVTQE